MKNLLFAALSAFASFAAHADCSPHPSAVLWRTEDGGNGHYYARIGQSLTWNAAKIEAELLGGHLATITSAAENAFVSSVANVGPIAPCHFGGVKLKGAWTWITGEPWGYSNWYIGEPNNQGGHENWLLFYSASGFWNDMEPNYVAEWLVEWSEALVDCNSNGACDGDEIVKNPGLDLNQDGVLDSCQCIADVVVDGAVNGVDLARILNDWGQIDSSSDIDLDGIVGGTDLAIVLSSWGDCSP
jgi:hypothetical protein